MGTPTHARENIQQDIDVGSKHQPLQTNRFRHIVSSLLSASALAIPMNGFAQEKGSEDADAISTKVSEERERMKALIPQLDDNTFSVRERASRELHEIIRQSLLADETNGPYAHDEIFSDKKYTPEQRYHLEQIEDRNQESLAWRFSRFKSPERWKTNPPLVSEVLQELRTQSEQEITCFALEERDVQMIEDLDGLPFWDVMDRVLRQTKFTIKQLSPNPSMVIGPSDQIRTMIPPLFPPFLQTTDNPDSTDQFYTSDGSVHGTLHINNKSGYRNNASQMPFVSVTLQSEAKIQLVRWELIDVRLMTGNGRIGMKLDPYCQSEGTANCYIQFYCPVGDGTMKGDIEVTVEIVGMGTAPYEVTKRVKLEFLDVTLPFEQKATEQSKTK